jgi:hypothetical protein
MAFHAVLFLIISSFAEPTMTKSERIMVEGTTSEKLEWADRYVHWQCVFTEARRDWAELKAHQSDERELRRLKEYRTLRDAAPRALLEYDATIDDDTLRTLQSIAWQVKAVFGEEPPIVRMVEEELECRGHFPQFLHLPDWFTR